MEWAVLIAVGLGIAAFFAAGCACCGCVIASDTFSRSDSTNIGSDWSEDAGTWEISSNTLKLTSASGSVTYQTPITEADIYIQHSLSQPAASPSSNNLTGTFRLYLKDDASNYVVGELSRVFGRQDAHLRVYRATSGTEVKLSEVMVQFVNNITSLRLCIDSSSGVVTFQASADYRAVAYTSAPFGEDVVLEASGLIDPLTIDNFEVGRLSASCTQCGTCCDTAQYPPHELQVEVSGLTSDAANCADCSSLDGTYTVEYQGVGFGAYNNGAAPVGCLWKCDLDTYCGVKTLAVWRDNVTGWHSAGFFDNNWGGDWTGVQRQRFYDDASTYLCNESEVVCDLPVNEGLNSRALCRVTFVTGTFTLTPL